MTRAFDWDVFLERPIVGILRGFEDAVVRRMVEAACRGGLTNIEVTMNSPRAEESIRAAIEETGGKSNVGAGTVLTREDLERALGAGASFIVTPVLLPDIIRACRERGVPVMAGALTPTEIYTAWSLGADYVKVFPANQLGPGYLKDVKAPLADVKLVPTGGVTSETLPAFHAAGADGFGVGGAVFSSERARAGNWAAVEVGARALVEAYRACSR